MKVGANVKSLKPGMSVVKITNSLAEWQDGTWQEYLAVDETCVQILPDDIDHYKITSLMISILPAWVMTVNILNLKPGQTLLMTGAGSAVGRLVLQLAAHRGFSVIGVVRRPEQVEEIKKLGAIDVICSSTEDVTKRALALTKLRGVDAAIDSVGGESATQCFKALADWGKLIIYGMLDMKRDSTFDIRKMLFSNLTVQGFWVTSWWLDSDVQTRSVAVNKCFDLVRKGLLNPPVEKEYKLEEFATAMAHAERPGNRGRIVFKT
jgi:NADPH:quinone reductase-like Zn-dependent oxidoreductase